MMSSETSGENGDAPSKGLEKNLDSYIDTWAPDLRDQWTAEVKLGDDDYRGMHRTSLITICGVREAKANLVRAHALNALYGNFSADMMPYENDVEALLGLAQPTEQEIGKLLTHGLITQEHTNPKAS